VAESEVMAGQTTPVPVKEKGSFAGDVLKLASGATVAQALGILLSPIFSRLFSPEAFGTAAVFGSITTVIGVVVCLRYELAIMLPEKDEDAANLLVGSLFFVGIFTALTILGVVFLREPVCRWLKAPELEPFLWMVPISVFLSGLTLALCYWNTRLKRFGLLSGLRVAASVSASSVELGTGFLGYVGAGSLIVSSVLSQAISAVGLGWQSLRKCDLRLWGSIKSYNIRKVLVRYKDFPRYSALSGLLNSFSWQLPNFLLSAFFSATVVGYCSMSLRVFNTPLSLIGGAIGQVFLQRAAEAKVTGTLPLVVENSFRSLVMLGLFPAMLLTVAGKSLFTFVFGEPWAEAGVYVQMLGFWLIFRFVSSPLSTLLSVLEKQRAGLALNSMIFLTRLISLTVGGILGSARLAILLFALSGAVIYGGLALWITRLAGVPWSHVKSIVLTSLKRGFLTALPLLIATVLQVSDLMQLVLGGVLLLFYYFWIVRSDKAFHGLYFRLKNRLRLGNG
jgi:lipopolysaccharide exporter